MNLAQFMNQYSYAWLSAVAFLVGAAVLWRAIRPQPARAAAIAVLAGALIAGNLLLRVGASEITSTGQFDAMLAARQPILLEIYSNY